MSDLQALVKLLQADQASLSRRASETSRPSINYVLDKIGQINLVLDKILRRSSASGEASPGSRAPRRNGARIRPPPASAKRPRKPRKKPPPPPGPTTNLSPQEVYNTAYADYLKGNFDLAIDGFKIYRENFPDSPLADNAALLDRRMRITASGSSTRPSTSSIT